MDSRAITVWARSAFPALSPRPFTVTWTWEAPPSTAARVFATARPKSLWQWTSMGQSTEATIFLISSFMAEG